MRPHDAHLIARVPFGEQKGVLPEPIEFTITHVARGAATLTISYSQLSARSDWLESPCEIEFELQKNGGNWFEPRHGSRFLVIKRSWDEIDKLRVRKYECMWLGFLLDRMRVWDPDDIDPGDPPSRPTRTFKEKTPGQIMVPLFNAALARVFPDGLVLHPPTKDFQLLVDSDGATWDVPVPGTQSFRIEEPLSAVEKMLVQAELAEPVWAQRVYQLWNPGTFGRDLTASSKPVIVRPTFDVSSAPEEEDLTDLCARVVATGEKGSFTYKEYDPEDPPDLSYGAWEAGVTAGGSDHPDALTMAARQAFRSGKQASAQITREGHSGTVGPRPLIDFEVYDSVWLFRGGAREKVECVETSLTWTKGKGLSRWHATFGDRHMDRDLRFAARQYRLSLGTQGGVIPDPPGPDVRVPLAPTGVEVVTTNITSSKGESRGDQTITWNPTVYLEDPDNPGFPTDPPVEAKLEGFEIGEERYGITSRIAFVRAAETSWRRSDVPIGARTLKVRAVTKAPYMIRSAYGQDPTSGTSDVVAQQEPRGGKNLVYDGLFANGAINDARAADAGAGFSFVSSGGRTRAQFTSTTPVLRSRVGGATTDDGWIPVTPGDRYLVGGWLRKVGSPACSCRFQVSWRDAAGTVTTVNISTTVATTSDVRVVTEWLVPAGALEANWRATMVTADPGAVLQVVDPIMERRTSTERLEDGSVVGGTGSGAKVAYRTLVADNSGDDAAVSRVIHGTDNLTTKHTSTGALFQAALGSSGWKGGLTGLFFYISGTARFSASSSGIYVNGTVETSSGAIFGGAGLLDIQFPTSGYSIGENGGFLEYNAGGSGHKFNGAVVTSGAFTAGGATQVASLNNLGAAKVNGLGSTLGFFAGVGSTKITLHNGLTNAARIAALEQALADYNMVNLTT